ncbi:MAG TPA: aspartyl protease family protein [Candidatus Acidoferrum sp.]|nr:aspartyl protease family protein [Candidatus Acidoferrum sp.]
MNLSCIFKRALIAVSIAMLFGIAAHAQNKLTDPYEIFNRHFQAIGGLDKDRTEVSRHFIADITAFGLTGTLEYWGKNPIFERQALDLKVFKQTSGDNGQTGWVADANGKVQLIKDDAALKRRQVRQLMAEYDFLNPKSTNFKLTLEGIQRVGDVECYVVKTSNSINDDYLLSYFSVADFQTVQELNHTSQGEQQTVYSDYRDVDGVKRAFHQEITDLPEKNKTSLQITKYEPNVDIDPSLFEPSGKSPSDFRFTQGSSSENVPFQYLMDHIFIPVNVNGKERLWVFDTGAEMSVIDSAFAAQLGIKAEGNIVGRGAGGTVGLSFAKMPPYSLQGIQFDGQTVAVIDVQKIFNPLELDVVGILGYDFISRFVVKVDYANCLMSFYDPATFKYTGSGKVVEAPLNGRVFAVPASVDGKYSGKWRLDIGATGCDFHYPFAAKNGLLACKGVENLAFGASGGFITRIVQFHSMQFCGYAIPKPLIGIPQDSAAGAFADVEMIGNIGNDVLRRFIIYLDFGRQQLILEPGKDFNRVFPTGKSGLQLQMNDQKQMEVLYVSPNTPSAKAGFVKGDIVESINDIPVDQIRGVLAVRELMKADAGTKYKFTILRDGKRQVLNLKLENLF